MGLMTQARVLPARGVSRARTTRVVAFLGARPQQLCDTATRLATTWGNAAHLPASEVAAQLRPLLAPGVVWRGDGILRRASVHGPADLLDALQREHATHLHREWRPVAVVASADGSSAFLALTWRFENLGQLLGGPATRSASRGVALQHLTFDEAGRVTAVRLCRQLTREERRLLVRPPLAAEPCDLVRCVLPKLASASGSGGGGGAAEARRMGAALSAWTRAWGGAGAEDDPLTHLDPNLHLWDAYGLEARAACHRRGEPPPAAQATSAAQALARLSALQRQFRTRCELRASAVDAAQLVGFRSWQGTATGYHSGEVFPLEGLDWVLFSPEGRVRDVVQFTMQDHDGVTAPFQ